MLQYLITPPSSSNEHTCILLLQTSLHRLVSSPAPPFLSQESFVSPIHSLVTPALAGLTLAPVNNNNNH